ncbi:hypothetical protein PsYK624_128510 [Phanerochaete sordida]|uniref:Uncharacterized protein n=1 Tax=Phanerochaete sordida TaxID=48140 RepID=A0A9P3GKI0_9APHY|nr:hypothetical protein PsYK624_128510 [Phanerochaete sordida]
MLARASGRRPAQGLELTARQDGRRILHSKLRLGLLERRVPSNASKASTPNVTSYFFVRSFGSRDSGPCFLDTPRVQAGRHASRAVRRPSAAPEVAAPAPVRCRPAISSSSRRCSYARLASRLVDALIVSHDQRGCSATMLPPTFKTHAIVAGGTIGFSLLRARLILLCSTLPGRSPNAAI